MKKFLALALALVMMVCIFASCGSPTPSDSAGGTTPSGTTSSTPSSEDTGGSDPTGDAGEPFGTVTVGTPAMNGDFIYGFGNSSYDKYTKDLTSGAGYYETYYTTLDGEIALNDTVVVESMTAETDADGNKVYTFKLFEDLLWSDGTPITAKDYVFAVLWSASPQWSEAGASSSAGDSLVGYQEYHGTATAEGSEDTLPAVDNFAGVKLLGDYEFSLAIDAANLPYFYETSWVSVYPLPMAVWAPGADIESGDDGAKITGVDLLAACNNVAATERYGPTVSCGPYKFVSFQDQICTLEVNPYFKHDQRGNKPQVQNVVIREVNQDTDVDQVINGDIDMVLGTIEGSKIDAAKSASSVSYSVYPRNGYGQISFHCDWGVTADINVRWGVASLIDRNEIVDYVAGGYAVTVDAEYGLSQWMYQERKAELQAAIKPISFNLDVANDYFDQTEWKFEADGTTPFDRTKATEDGSYMRHNSEGKMFVIEHMGTTENTVSDAVSIQYAANAPLAGLKVNFSQNDFSVLLDNYYYGYEKGEDRMYNSFNLGNGFDAVYDPYYNSYHSDYCGTWVNSNQLSDPELDRLIEEMRSLEPTQTEEFADAWVAYQTRWNALLPCLPLYSNEYHDIYNNRIGGLETTPFINFAQNICPLYVVQ